MTEAAKAQEFAVPELLGKGEAEDLDLAPDPEQSKFEQDRRSGIGGTDAAAIVGLHPYRTLWDVVAEKKGLIPSTASNERMQIGQDLEDPVARMYARREHCRVRRVNELWRDRTYPFLIGHPDRLVIGRKKGLEVKTFDGRNLDEWSEPGEPVKVPKHYYLQCQWYMGLRDFEAWDLAVLIGLRQVRVYKLERNEFVIRRLRERAREVWERYVLTDDMPLMEDSAAARRYLREKHPEQLNDTLIADERLNELVPQWREAKDANEAAETRVKNLRAAIAEIIGDNMGAVGPDWAVTFKKNRNTVEMLTDYEGLLIELSQRHGFTVEAEDIARFTKEVVTKIGPRVLREVKKGRK